LEVAYSAEWIETQTKAIGSPAQKLFINNCTLCTN